MSGYYKKIIVAVALDDKADAELMKHVKRLTQDSEATVTLVHAVEQFGGYNAYGVGIGFDIEKRLLEESIESMKRVGKKLGVAENRLVVRSGPAKLVILDEAESQKADLIVVGSHGKHGIQILLGSTSNAVLHGAKCDVLAVRLKN